MKNNDLYTVYNCSLIELSKIENNKGNITPVQGSTHIPFDIARVFYLYDIPGGEARGAHAHKECHQFLIAAHGAFDVVLDDGVNKRTVVLNRPNYGLHIPPGIWAAEQSFSSGAICLVLTSHVYDETDYIRDYESFMRHRQLSNQSIGCKYLHSKDKEDGNKTTIYDCMMIELNKHHHQKGNITVVENGQTIPFNVQRTYYLYDVPGGESRGGHAHKELRQLIVAASGNFDVQLDDSSVKRTFTLNRPYQGLLVMPGIWRELSNFSSGSVCLVLASHEYDENDYIRNYNDFLKYKKCKNLDR